MRQTLAASLAAATFPPMSITVIVENDTIKLPVHVPDGTPLEITLPPEGASPESAAPAPGRTLAERYAKFVGLADDLPPDMAKNHDHYLHGAPKRP
jgi:hypothetical protein